MATVLVDRSTSGTLAAGVVDTVQLGTPADTLQVFNKSASDPMYVRLDGIDPVVGGDGSKYVPPGESRLFPTLDSTFPEIRLITAAVAGVAYIVERFP